MNYCELARQSLAYFLEHGSYMPTEDEVGRSAGCFVSLHTADGELRGCIGTIQAVKADLIREIVHNAVSAGTRDPRFPKVSLDELKRLQIEVSVLAEPEPIRSIADLDVVRYGVVVQSGLKRGVLLPDLEGIETVVQQVSIAKRKAHIGDTEDIDLFRFGVEKYHE